MRNFLTGIAKAGRELLGLGTDRGHAREFNELSHELLKLKGEASAIALADDLLTQYANLDADARAQFFLMLLEDMQPPEKEIERAIRAYQDMPAAAHAHELEPGCGIPAPRFNSGLEYGAGGH